MKKRSVFKNIILTIISFMAFLLLFASWWFFHTWSTMTVNELMFNVKMSLSGTSHAMIKLFALKAFLPAFITAFVIFIFLSLTGKKEGKRKSTGLVIALDIAALICFVAYTWIELDMTTYIDQQIHASTFIEDNYVNPDDVTMEFPEKKRNLIYLYVESLEVTDADKENGGAFDKSRIPELTDLAYENECFNGGTGTLNGGFSMPGTDWTMGAIFAQSTGLPLQISIEANSMEKQETFFPTVKALGDILRDQGYHQEYLCGSDATFGGRELFFVSHGGYDIVDYPYAKDQGWIPQDYGVWWGFEDEKLYEYARNRLTDLSQKDEPFNLTLLTVDTHFEDGYKCRLCEDEFEDNYSNVYACASRQAVEFIEWVKQQDFYDNTTIGIAGDHPTMDADFCAAIPEDFTRKVYTCVLNSAAVDKPENTRREFTTFDLFPTTIAALGVKIEGNRLGLGANLFSSEQTLLEKYGMEYEKEELDRKSHFMNTLAGMSAEDIAFQNYKEPTADVSITVEGTEVKVTVENVENNIEQVKNIELEVTPEGDRDKRFSMTMDKTDDGYYEFTFEADKINERDTDFRIYLNGTLGSRYTLQSQSGDMSIKQTVLDDYLTELKKYAESGDYTIFVTTRKSGLMRLTASQIEQLHELGITDEIAVGVDTTIVGVIGKDNAETKVSKEDIEMSGKINENIEYHLKGSCSGSKEEDFLMDINGRNLMVDQKGLHFSVINNETGRVADYVDFDLLDKMCRRY